MDACRLASSSTSTAVKPAQRFRKYSALGALASRRHPGKGQPARRRCSQATATYLAWAAPPQEIEAQGWSFTPDRSVGVAAGETVSDEDFKEPLESLSEELETLNVQARDLEQTIAGNVAEILEA